jgi:hypothetical protein
MTTGDSANIPPGQRPAGPKQFNCPNCGASLSVTAQGQTLVVACKSCGSVVDVTDENYKILSQARASKLYEPTIPIGAKGKLRGETWKVIGFLVRKDVASGHLWNEYLLYNPRQGFRWLTENNGHWNYVIMTRKEVKYVFSEPHYQGYKYSLYHKGEAQIVYVVGEFYWRVAVRDRSQLTDYIRPPEMLSLEQSGSEKMWSIGEYIEPSTLKEGFAELKGYEDQRVGVAPNQPQGSDTYWKDLISVTGFLILLLVAVQVFSSVFVSRKIVFRGSYNYTAGMPSQNAAEPIELTSWRSALDIEFYADVTNGWFAADFDLTNDETGRSVEFEEGVEFYTGRDSDGTWTEGKRSKTISLSSVPRGKYHLLVTPSSTQGVQQATYSVRVTQGPVIWSNFIWTFLGLAMLPIFIGILRYRFELKRWRESDYAPMWARSGEDDSYE